MGPVLATEGELRQTATTPRADRGRWREADERWDILIGVQYLPYCSAIWVLKMRRNWYKSLRTAQKAD
jgi:hypothetical protein